MSIISGSWSGSANGHASLQVVCDVLSQGIDTNGPYSNVKLTAQWSLDTTGYTTNKSKAPFAWNVEGESISGTVNFAVGNYSKNQWYSIGDSVTRRINHNEDGTKSFSVAYSLNLSGTSFGTGSVNASVVLPAIAMASTPSAPDITITGSTKSVSVSLAIASSSYTHDYEVTYGTHTLTGNTAAGVTSKSFSIPASWFPTVSSARVTVKVTTKNGTQVIGAKTTSFGVVITATPSVTIATSKVNLGSAAPSDYVTRFTAVKVTATPTAGSGSSVDKVLFYQSGILQAEKTAAPWEWTSPALQGNELFSVRVVDKRGNGANSSATSITPAQYKEPVLTDVNVYRSDATGTPDSRGTYISIIATATPTCTTQGNSLSTLLYFYKRVSASTYTQGTRALSSGELLTTSGWNLSYSYNIKITATDAFGGSSSIVYGVPTASATISRKAGGNGVAFGKIATENDLLDSAWPTKAPSFVSKTITDATTTHFVVVPRVQNTVLGVSSSNERAYFEALIKWICFNYQGKGHHIFVGAAYPGSIGLYMLEIYATGTHASLEETVLPNYCNGIYMRGRTTSSANGPQPLFYFGSTSGTYYFQSTVDSFGNIAQKQFLASPTGATGTPSFRSIVASDLPAITNAMLPTIETEKLPTGTASSGIITSVSGATLSAQEVRMQGHMCNMYLEFNAGTVSGGSTITLSVADAYKPAIGASGVGYFTTSSFVAQLNSAGAMTIRNCSSTSRTFSESSPLRIALTYYI